jgi:hypothetical protein
MARARHRRPTLLLGAAFALSACGQDELVDPTAPPEHTPTLESTGVTLFVKLGNVAAFGTDGTSSESVVAQATFYDPTAAFTLLAYTFGDCLTTTSKQELTKHGGMEQDVGAAVTLTAEAGDFPLALNAGHARYEGNWPSGTALTPWQRGEWLGLDAGGGRVVHDAAFAPDDPLRIAAPAAGSALGLGSDVTVRWNAAPESALAFVQVNVGQSAVMCISPDDGELVIPAATLALITDDGSLPSVAVHRYFSWRLDRRPEVLHLLIQESAVNYLVRP